MCYFYREINSISIVNEIRPLYTIYLYYYKSDVISRFTQKEPSSQTHQLLR